MGGPEIVNNNDSKIIGDIKSESSRTKEEIINFTNHEKKKYKRKSKKYFIRRSN